MKKIAIFAVAAAALSSCVSQKEHLALQNDLEETKTQLKSITEERDALNEKMGHIQKRISTYYSKINDLKKEVVGDEASIEESPGSNGVGYATGNNELAERLLASLGSEVRDNNNVNIYVDQEVISISLANNLLFNSGGYRIKRSANDILAKIASVVNEDDSVSIMVEGHTDNIPISRPGIADNWDLSVKRATSVVRKLQKTHKVDPKKMIASGRSSYMPLVENDNRTNRAKNRRIRILILPNIYKHLSLIEE
ncbi:OmpA family protein [Sungkyunkwania multivorans]|uniref:OmpA family protein n=1 Tax=Sungkyunkwania multivorans TaxID=1173618 RepID=A0ABW3CZE2_9FLAO